MRDWLASMRSDVCRAATELGVLRELTRDRGEREQGGDPPKRTARRRRGQRGGDNGDGTTRADRGNGRPLPEEGSGHRGLFNLLHMCGATERLRLGPPRPESPVRPRPGLSAVMLGGVAERRTAPELPPICKTQVLDEEREKELALHAFNSRPTQAMRLVRTLLSRVPVYHFP